MKKSLLAVLLAVAMAVPAFAAKGDMSVNAKLGLGVNSNIAVSFDEMGSDMFYGLNVNMPFMLGAEFFYATSDMLSVGVGANYVFDTAAKVNSKIKGGTTNIYLTVKPTAKIDSNIFTALYAIGQIGYCLNRISLSSKCLSIV